MRVRVLFTSMSVVAAAASFVLLQPATAQRRPRGGGSATDVVASDASVEAGPPTTASPSSASMDGGGSDAGATVVAAPNSFNLPMQQRGAGALMHFPIPEQLARNDVPIFVQVRSSAPLDHVSMFFRGQGATRYRETRMTAMGREQGLQNGYGAQVPCEDVFPPSIEYYVQAIDTSGESVGHAGTATQPLRLPIVTARTHNIVPTLPGQAAPRNCGSLTAMSLQSQRDAGTVEVRGTSDLGESCAQDNECRRGLRCGLSRTCVFVSAPR